MRPLARTVARTIFSLLTCLLAASAQQPAGELRIRISDPSGAPTQASGRLIPLSGGAARSFGSDAQGQFTFTGLADGRYRLEVAKTGFAAQSLQVQIQSAQPVTESITLRLSAMASQVDVVATTPLAGAGISRDEIAAPVQTAGAQDLARSGALDLSDFLNRRLDGVHINENQGNPFQPDVNYRGYTASPLLGTPQGLSIYMDGVRMNQPFGDVVSWDLIPRFAISEVSLIPGSNPIFGLNTLGGALSIQTQDGLTHPGAEVQVSGGSFGRKAAELQYGGSNARGFNWYVAGNLLFEDGWRAASPTDLRQFFGKLGWQGARTQVGLGVGYANNALIGNGLQEQRFLARDYSSVYTIPDITANRAPFLNLTARRLVGANLSLSGNVYYRYIRTNTLNGDINEGSLDQSVYQPSAAEIAALTAAGYRGFPTSGATAANTPFPFWRCIGQVLLRDEPGEKCNGMLNRTHSGQNNYGLSGQATWLGTLGGHHNQFTAGAGFDGSSVAFQQSSQLGYLNPDRSITPLNAFADGVTGGNVDGEPLDTRVDLHGVIRTGSVYATDTLSIGNAWHFTVSGRYNRTTIDNRDRIRPAAGSGSLTGTDTYGRFNPAAGVTYNPIPAVSAYASYSEGSRAPTSIELGCADPEQPCKLPNALAGDPPLKQVVTRTFEAGLRGKGEGGFHWNVGWFRGQNRDDILFVASTQTGFGYFKNFGRTRRQGVEASASATIHRVTAGANYTFLDATYQSPETVDGSSNSTNSEAGAAKGLDGTIAIAPGARIPLIPQHMGKIFVDIEATSRLSADLDMVAVSGSYARGNENNQHQADGQYYLGPGTSPGYAVFNAGARYKISRRIEIFAQINNLLNRRYYSAAQLGPTGFNAAGNFQARPFPSVAGEFPVVHATFYAPGVPRGAWGGLRFRF